MVEEQKPILKKVVKREQWSKLGFIFAVIASAVGIGNIWRFPYLAGKNGGGAFLIPYLIAVVLIAFPVVLLEFAAGWEFQTSILHFFKKLGARTKFLGWFFMVILLAILSYYVVIVGWILAYFIFSFTGYGTFASFSSSLLPILFFLACIAILFVVDSLGIKKGIEKLCKYTMPIVFIFLIILLIRALTLPNAMAGVKFFLTPNFSMLADPKIWIFAFSQAFFSIGVGFGLLMTYASYADRKLDIPLTAITISISDTIIAIIAGLVIFPLVFSLGLNPAQGPELAFIALPKVFSLIPFGRVFGAIFFLLLFLTGLTSAISIGEGCVSSLIDEYGMKRRKATGIIYAIALAVGIPSVLSYSSVGFSVLGKPFLDGIDYVIGSLTLPIVALIFTITVSWFWSSKKFINAVNKHTRLKMPHWIIYIIRYFIPLVLFLVFIVGIVT